MTHTRDNIFGTRVRVVLAADAVRTAGLRPAPLKLPFSSTNIPACAPSCYSAKIANACPHHNIVPFEFALSSVGARHAVPARSNSTAVPSTSTPAHLPLSFSVAFSLGSAGILPPPSPLICRSVAQAFLPVPTKQRSSMQILGTHRDIVLLLCAPLPSYQLQQ